MTNLKINIFNIGEEEPETKITIPFNALRMANKLLPKKAASALEKEGIDLNQLVALSEEKEARGTLIEIENKKQKIIISIDE